jgi:major membrane immunogen (membrane-anchored lipoprotein)
VILYFIKPQKTGEAIRAFEDKTERPDYLNKKWYLIGKISIEDGKVVNVTYFENLK